MDSYFVICICIQTLGVTVFWDMMLCSLVDEVVACRLVAGQRSRNEARCRGC
jgi:hypothetical protein